MPPRSPGRSSSCGARRGIGTFTTPQDADRRIVWTLLFYREQPDDNPYAKPVHGGSPSWTLAT
jgi:Cu2+-containing amine oxidase